MRQPPPTASCWPRCETLAAAQRPLSRETRERESREARDRVCSPELILVRPLATPWLTVWPTNMICLRVGWESM